MKSFYHSNKDTAKYITKSELTAKRINNKQPVYTTKLDEYGRTTNWSSEHNCHFAVLLVAITIDGKKAYAKELRNLINNELLETTTYLTFKDLKEGL